MNTKTRHFSHRDGKTVYHADGYDKIVVEALITPCDTDNGDTISLHLVSIWLDQPMTVDVPASALADRHRFSARLGELAHPMIKFLGNTREFEAFVAEELGVEPAAGT
jgi:hypothetical protein